MLFFGPNEMGTNGIAFWLFQDFCLESERVRVKDGRGETEASLVEDIR